MIANGNIFGKQAAEYSTVKLARAYVRKTIDGPSILKKIDTSESGYLNLSATNSMYQIEDKGPGTIVY